MIDLSDLPSPLPMFSATPTQRGVYILIVTESNIAP